MSHPVAHAEVLGLLVRHLAELPVPTTLEAEVPEVGRVLLTTSRARYAEATLARTPAVSALEYEALTIALADGACDRQRALYALGLKREGQGYRIDGRALLGPVVRPDLARARRWTFGDLLDALGARLVAVEVHGARALPAEETEK